jgi:hypothetical protein
MTNQTEIRNSLGGSPAGVVFSRSCTLILAAILATGGAVAGFAQDKPDAAKPARPVSEKKPAPELAAKISHGYMIHQSLEVGGRFTTISGSTAMWDTLVNQGSGGRILGQSLEMHSVDPSKTPFFDTLTTYSTGYGGDPYDVSRLAFSKGRLYDFAGSFRRDRNYFDYNLLDSSLLSTATAANPVLVPEPDSLHLFNTVRRNTDTTLTLFPLSRISFRAGFNHGTHEGPSFTSVHNGGDVQLLQWFRNASDTYTGGVDVRLVKRTSLSYDQFYVLYKGDSTFGLTGANYPTLNGNGQKESLGVNTLAATTCGTGANKSAEVVNGIANPYCSGTIVQSQVAPTRTTFPTEQLRFSSHYWDKVAMNGRILYSGGTSDVKSFNETFNGLLTRTFLRQEIDTGGLAHGALAHNKRVDVNADFGIVAELNKYISVSDSFDFWKFRSPGSNSVTANVWAGTATTPNLNILTPLSAVTNTTTTTPNASFLNQKIGQNTILAIFSVTPQIKLSGGWRFKSREITDPGDDLTWHENWALLGAVFQPSRAFRINVNYDRMSSKSATADTPANSFTREAPDKSYHVRVRATVKPAKWINFAVTGNDYSAKNDDPLVNHIEHNHDFSIATSITPMEGLSLDFDYAHDDFMSQTDLCYLFVGTATYPVPTPATASTGTCLQTATNPTGTLPPPGTAVASQLYLGAGTYDAPSNFFSGAINYDPSRYFHFNAGARVNATNGTAEQLNPLMVPGALQSRYVTPFTDLEIHIASQWAWHGNWTHDGYHERGPQGLLPSRNTYGDILTLGVKYAF